jgi:hypothetical protein
MRAVEAGGALEMLPRPSYYDRADAPLADAKLPRDSALTYAALGHRTDFEHLRFSQPRHRVGDPASTALLEPTVGVVIRGEADGQMPPSGKIDVTNAVRADAIRLEAGRLVACVQDDMLIRDGEASGEHPSHAVNALRASAVAEHSIAVRVALPCPETTAIGDDRMLVQGGQGQRLIEDIRPLTIPEATLPTRARTEPPSSLLGQIAGNIEAPATCLTQMRGPGTGAHAHAGFRAVASAPALDTRSRGFEGASAYLADARDATIHRHREVTSPGVGPAGVATTTGLLRVDYTIEGASERGTR